MPVSPGRAPAGRRRYALLGFGRIGRLIAERLAAEPDGPELVAVLGRTAGANAGAAACRDLDDLLARGPEVVVECASAAALAEAGPPILAAGADLMPLSLTAFADPTAEARLTDAARRGPGRIEIPSGAAAALGLLTAARAGGLRSVLFRQAYPVAVWRGTAAAGMVDLEALQAARAFYRGPARAAAGLFPRNLNAATGVALAGLGLDRTTVELVADPTLATVRYDLEIEADPGPIRLSIGPRPAPGPDYTAFTVVAALVRRGAAIAA